MLCPYCKVDYTPEQPCFCHPPAQSRQAEKQALAAKPSNSPTIAWNAHRGVRLD